jgi:hypothetical protein
MRAGIKSCSHFLGSQKSLTDGGYMELNTDIRKEISLKAAALRIYIKCIRGENHSVITRQQTFNLARSILLKHAQRGTL